MYYLQYSLNRNYLLYLLIKIFKKELLRLLTIYQIKALRLDRYVVKMNNNKIKPDIGI